MRERSYVADTRIRHPSPPGVTQRHRKYSPRRGRNGGKYSRQDESRRIGRRDGFDRELDMQGGRFYDTVERERYGAGPKRSRSPRRSDRDRNPQAGRFSDAVYVDRSGIGPRHSWSPQRVEKWDSFDADLNPRAGGFSDNVDRDRLGIGPRRSRSPRRIEKRDSFGVDPNPRTGSFVDAVDKDSYRSRSRHLMDLRRINGRDGFDGDSDLHTGRFCDAVGRDSGAGYWYSRSPRRFGERDAFEGDLSLQDGRFSDTLDRDRFGVHTRHSRCPGRIEKRDNYDLDMNVLGARFSGYDNRDTGKYGLGVECSRRLCEEDLFHGGSSSSKFEFDHLSDVPRNSDGPNMKYICYKNDIYGVGDDNITPGGGGKRVDYLKNSYLEEGQIGMSSVSHNLATKPVFLEYDKGRRFYSDPGTLAYESVGGVTKSYLGAGDGNGHLSSVASRNLNTDTDRQGFFNLKDERQLEKRDAETQDQGEHCFGTTDEGFNFNDGLYLDKLGIERPVGREMYEDKKDDNLISLQGHLKGNSSYMVSSSRSKDYIPMSSEILTEGFPGHSIAGDIPLLSHGLQAGTGLVSDPYGFDGYNGRPRHMSPSKLGCRFDNIKNKSRLYVGLPGQNHKDNIYLKFGGSTKPRDFGEEYGVLHMSRFLNSVDETSRRNHTEDDRLGHKRPSLGQSTSDNFVECGSLQSRNQDLDMLGSGSLHLNFEREKYHGCGRVQLGEYNDEVHDGSRSLAERSEIFTTQDDPMLCSVNGSQRNGMDLADLRLIEPSQRRPGGKYPMDNILYEHNTGIRISSDGSSVRKIYNDLDAGDDEDPSSFLERPESSKHKLEKSKREAREIAGNMFSSSRFITSRSSDPHASGSRDIKKRVGPVRRRLHVSQRLLDEKKPSLKKQLAPAPSKKHSTLPWLKSRSSKKVSNTRDDSNGNHHDQGGERLGDYFPLAIEPPEKSEDFKQRVHSAFFKFLKQINETWAKRNKYAEPGNDGSVKCIVCSSSEDFVDTVSLAKHAFTYKKVGLRSQHLGFYRALCVLMGWKIAEEPISDWRCEVLSNAETSAVKEDLIIWPPVMIIHNCSIDNKMTDEWVTVSTDTLDAKLRGMGIGSILKICNGKPANQSVMIVKFNGTLSGLQEAERLFQHYVENNHGRSHLEQLKSSKNGSSSGDTKVAPADEEALLYGYLGTSEDLDKLDSDTKKRCVVKSKKEILSIAKSSLDSNAENGSFKRLNYM